MSAKFFENYQLLILAHQNINCIGDQILNCILLYNTNKLV